MAKSDGVLALRSRGMFDEQTLAYAGWAEQTAAANIITIRKVGRESMLAESAAAPASQAITITKERLLRTNWQNSFIRIELFVNPFSM